MMRSSFVAATAALLFTATGSAAQSGAADAAQVVTQGAGGCEDAASRLATNTLPRVGAPAWSDWVTLTGCGSRGATVIAGALRSDGIRTETELNRLDHLAGILDGWFQPQLVNAYEALLRAPEASNAMRLRAMWLLAGLYEPNVDVAGPLQGYMSLRCETYDRGTTLRDAPETLPSSVYEEAQDAMAFVADDRSAPEYLRSTARCWERVLRDALRNGTTGLDDRRDEPATVVVERPVRVIYECDNRFVFYNDAGYDLAVRYSGYGSGGVLRVAHGGPFVWVAGRFGPVRFYVGDREVYYAPAVYRPCGRTRVIVGASVGIWGGWHSGLGVFVGVRNRGYRVVRPRIVIAPRVVFPRRTVIVVPQGRRNDPYDRRDRDWNDGRRNDRGRDDRTYGERDDRGGRVGGTGRRNPREDDDRDRGGRTYGDRTATGSGSGSSGGAGRRAETTPPPPTPGQRHGSVPLPRQPEGSKPRFAVPNTPPGESGPGRSGSSGDAEPRGREFKGKLGGAFRGG